MSIFDKSRYLRALFILLPAGIMLFYIGIKGLTSSIEDLPYSKGIVSKYYIGDKYHDYCECTSKTFFIYLKGKNKPYITTITKDIEKLNLLLNKGDRIEIWTWNKTKENQIEQVKINGELIIPYDKTIGLYIAFLIVGLGLVVLCIFYIIKSPEDLFGKKKYNDKES